MRMSIGYLEPLVFIIFLFFFGCHICACKFIYTLPSMFQDGGNQFPVTRPSVLSSVTDSSRHMLLLPALHSQWSCQVYIMHRSITGFLVVHEPTCTPAHEDRLLVLIIKMSFLSKNNNFPLTSTS